MILGDGLKMIEQQIIRTLEKSIPITKITRFERGTINRAYEIQSGNEYYVFKEHTKQESKDLIVPISILMNYFSSAIPVPKVRMIGENEYFQNGFLLMEKCNGELIADNKKGITKSFIDELLNSINTISQTRPEIFLYQEIKNFEPRLIKTQGEFYQTIMNMVQKTIGILKSSDSIFYRKALNISSQMEYNPSLHSREKTSLSHNDLSEENLFSNGTLTGIIDFDSISMGDSDFDKHYSLVHLVNIGIDSTIASYGLESFFGTALSPEKIAKGIFTSQFSALQKIMILRKRIIAQPEKKREYVEETMNFIDNFMNYNNYEGLLNEH